MPVRTYQTAQDLYIAKRLRARRLELGLTQAALAQALNISAQQIGKYEKSIDRLPASRLPALSCLLHVPLTFFFEAETATLSSEKEIAIPGVLNHQRFVLKLKLESKESEELKAAKK